MLTDEQLVQRLRAALENESAGIVPPPDLLDSIHRQLRSSPAPERPRLPARFRRPRPRLAHLAPVAALLAVVVVVAVFLGVQGRKPVGPAARGGFALVYRAEPTAQVPVVNHAALARAVSIMRRRIATLLPGGGSSVTVTSVGTEILVHVGGRSSISRQQLQRAEQLVGTTARLEFYDWEANALTPSGKTVAQLLPTQDPTAVEISQGSGAAAPGSPGAGSMSLYQAVELASKQPYEASGSNARAGSEYFAFGAAGSPACTQAAQAYHVAPFVGERCYLAGPQGSIQDLDSALPAGVSSSDAQVLTVQRGTVVLQAVAASYARAPQWFDPTAQFYVLRDHVSLFGNEITNPQQSSDQSGSPDLKFGFTSNGANEFKHVTAQIAHRGAVVSNPGSQFNQHFAVALDTQLITVPSLDYMAYPDGISGVDGADITGGFTIQSARDLATQLRLGALPIDLKLIAELPRG